MTHPNILFITSDQQHYSTLGSVNPKIQTPALDRLATEGVRFDRGYCCNPLCTPSRASMITGMYPSQHGAWTIGVKLPEDVPTLGGYLHTRGYESILVGKAHFQPLADRPDLGSSSVECQPCLRDLEFWRTFNERHTPWYGFDHVELGRMHTNESHVGQHYALWLEEKGLKNWRDYFDPWPPKEGASSTGPAVWDLPEELHYNAWISERVTANIERCVEAGKPFFAWASFFDPHAPLIVTEPWYSLYDPEQMEIGRLREGELDRMPPPHRLTQEKNPDFSPWAEEYGNHGYHSHRKGRDERWLRKAQAVYYGMVSFTDQHVGRILDTLDRLGVADQTLVVYTSDHGEYLGQHGLITKGAFHYEDGIRVPLLARWPGQIQPGSVRNDLQSLVDLSPTFLEAAGHAVPGAMTGRSRVRNWTSGEEAREHVLVENRHQPTRVHLRTYVTDDAKITIYRGQTYGELFDLRRDPGEYQNLWDDPSAAGLKSEMLHKALRMEMEREPTRMPRVAGA
jgi:uncharacterized sulfatase